MVILAEKADKTEMQSYRKVINEILWDSLQEKRRSTGINGVGSLAGVSMAAVIRKLRGDYSSGSFGNDVRRVVVPKLNELENLESRLRATSAKIQSMEHKELMDVFLIHRNHGLELTLDYILDGEK